MFSASKSGQFGGYTISRSVRLRSSASAYLNRTFTSVGTRTTFTYSVWLKRGTLGSIQRFFSDSSNNSYFRFDGSDLLEWNFYTGTSYTIKSSQVFRDPSAWYHIMVAVDTTQATSSNRVKFYVNGTQVTAFSTASYPTQNSTSNFNNNTAHYISSYSGSAEFFDGYLTEINFIDGQALTPSSFGQYNAYGVWSPLKYNGTYGTNGFYLNFSDNSAATAAAIGKDYSGNGNNWTPNNISVTAGATYDSMIDVPTLWGDGSTNRGNYPVLNPLWRLGGAGQATPSNGNLTGSSLGNNILASTIPLPSTGKWYMEFTLTTGQYPEYGIASSAGVGGGSATGNFGAYYNGFNNWVGNGSSGTSDGNQATTTGDIGLIAVDVDNNKLWIGRTRSGTTVWMGGGSPSAGTSPSFSASGGGGVYATTFNAQTFNNPFVATGAGSDVWDVNFGQRPFTNTPPTGFKALNTFNLPAPTIGNGANYMAATTYTGTGSSLSVSNGNNNTTGVTFKPDLVWIKSRSAATDHKLTDSVRGTTKALISDTTGAETTDTNGLTAFGTGGFTVGTDTVYNNNTATYVGWQWQAGQGTTSSNTSGSITSTVSVNTTAGFSVVTYTGNGTAGATVGHGLGVAPNMIIVKNRTTAGTNWLVYHAAANASPGTGGLYLDNTLAFTSSIQFWNNTAPTSSVFSLYTNVSNNESGKNLVAYCWAAIAGYSAFGSYTGNGSSDGPFIYCGFRPRFILFKDTTVAFNWVMVDTSRDTYNCAQYGLYPNLSNAEGSGTPFVDILSNGFKYRFAGGGANTSGDTIIYAAFAENPFKYSNAR